MKQDAQILLARTVAVISRFGVVNLMSTKTGSTVRIFMNYECSLFARFLTFLESLDREIDLEDVQDHATAEHFAGWPADVTWMNRQLFNDLAQKLKETPSRR